MIINQFDKTDFLRQYWQKRPCVIKGFIKDFIDPIDEHELAGLAQETEIDSRVIAKVENNWQVTSGPIEDFDTACNGNWTLLVQGVDKQIPEVNELIEFVNFIPHWRLDDVMVSFSIENAGVGPHLDEYDVIIVQGKGRRRWQVGLPDEYETLIPHPKIRQIKHFNAIIDEVLEPGDAVYIPPLHPHNGIALAPCINYSMGFRAMTNYELLNGLFDTQHFKSNTVKRYQDPEQSISDWMNRAISHRASTNHCVSQAELQALKSNMISLIKSQSTNHAIIQALSNQHLNREVLSEEQQYSHNDVEQLFENNAVIYPLLGLRPLYQEQEGTKQFYFFADGETLNVDIALKELIQMLISDDEYKCDIATLNRLTCTAKDEWIKLIRTVLNLGLWIYEID